MNLDFQDIKNRVLITDAAAWLGLDIIKGGDQYRCECPIHGGGKRALVITPAKGLFTCFGVGSPPYPWGDVIKLVEHVHQVSAKEAAQALATQFLLHPQRKLPPGGLDYLKPEHASIQALGVSPETAKHFKAGYAEKGIMRGRFAIPVLFENGSPVHYCGYAVKKDQHPRMLFPKDFDPGSVIFNAANVQPGVLHVLNDPLKVLIYHQNGETNSVAVMSEMGLKQFEMLLELMKAKQITYVVI